MLPTLTHIGEVNLKTDGNTLAVKRHEFLICPFDSLFEGQTLARPYQINKVLFSVKFIEIIGIWAMPHNLRQ